jgi:hypothetical protein
MFMTSNMNPEIVWMSRERVFKPTIGLSLPGYERVTGSYAIGAIHLTVLPIDQHLICRFLTEDKGQLLWVQAKPSDMYPMAPFTHQR